MASNTTVWQFFCRLTSFLGKLILVLWFGCVKMCIFFNLYQPTVLLNIKKILHTRDTKFQHLGLIAAIPKGKETNKKERKNNRRKKNVFCHMSHVRCQVSHVTFHVSVVCHLSPKKLSKGKKKSLNGQKQTNFLEVCQY